MNDISTFLKKLDLSEKEIRVYLLGLKHGPLPATKLAKTCDITRPNVYDVLKKLQEKGLCTQLGSAYGRKIKMATPEEMETLLESKKQESVQLQNEFKDILPDLISLKSQNQYFDFPQVTYFEGVEGIKRLFEDSLQTKNKVILMALSENNIIKLLGREFSKYYIEKRTARGITSKTLRKKGGDNIDPFFKDHQKHKREVRYLPSSIQMSATIFIYDNKVSLITTKNESLGLLLHSKDYSETFRSWFEFVWSMSK